MRNLFVIAFLNQDNLCCLKIREKLEKNREHIGNIHVKVAYRIVTSSKRVTN